MFLYILKRAFRSFLTLFFIITIVFSLLRLMPIEGYFSNYEKMSETQIKVELSRQNLDKPLPIQLWMFYKNIIKGDFGLSMKYRVNYPVTKIIAEKAPLSIRMGLLAMLVSLLVGIPLGILMAHSAKSRIGVWDKLGTVFAKIFGSAAELAKAINSGQKSIRLRITGQYITKVLGFWDYAPARIDQEIEVPLPGLPKLDPEEAVRLLQDALQKLNIESIN